MGRKVEVRAKHKPMPTIIGAGITEQWYFTHLKFLYDYQIKVRPRFFGNETADGMAKKMRNPECNSRIRFYYFN